MFKSSNKRVGSKNKRWLRIELLTDDLTLNINWKITCFPALTFRCLPVSP